MTARSSRLVLARTLALGLCLSGVGCGATQRIALPTSDARARDATAWHIVSTPPPPPPPPVESPGPEPEPSADAVVPDGSNAEAAAGPDDAAAGDEAIIPQEAADASASPGPDSPQPPAQPAPAARAPTAAATSWDEPTDDDDAEPKRVTRSIRFHDGSYSRYGMGGGYQSVSNERGSSLTGSGVSLDVWFGGTPAPGWAVGAMWSALLVANPDASISAADNNGVAVSGQARGMTILSSLGTFVDFYPDPRAGLHFMAGLSYSSFSFTTDAGESSESADGVGLLGGAGYEGWIGSEWSLGLLARLQWALLSDSSGTTTALAPVILLGLTCH